MELKKLEDNFDRIAVLSALYEDILNAKYSMADEEIVRLKLKYARAEILKLLMENKTLLKRFELEEKP